MAALHARCFPETPRSWSAVEFAELTGQSATVLVARAAGFALGRVAGPEAELLTLAVAPEARRYGHGAALVSAFEAAALARGACETFLEVSETNVPARALYAKCGYLQAGRRPGYYVHTDAAATAAIVLRKALRAGHSNP